MTARQLLLPLCSCLLACAGAAPRSIPAWYTARAASHPRYPASRFVTGAGVSTVSAEDAAQRAQAEVAAQISSRIESELVSFERESTREGAVQDVQSRTRVRTDFERNDLVRVVDTDASSGTFYAFAALDREEAARELATAMGKDLAAFQAAARAARAADADGQAQVFATAAAQAARLRPAIEAGFVRRRAISGRPAADEKVYADTRDQLLVAVARHQARRVVGVVFKAAGSGHLGDYAVNAVKRLGLRPDAVACDGRRKADAADATELEVEPVESCGEGSLGERCEVTVHLTARACEGDTAGRGTVAMVRAIHPSDREKALRAAWDKVTQQAVESAVREALQSALETGE